MPIPQSQTTAKPAPPSPKTPPAVTALGALLLMAAAGAAGTLAVSHIAGIAIPGCGGGSDCAKAAASAWGSIPGVKWPVSFLGTAYFTGLLVAWLLCKGTLPGGLRWIARLGAAASILYLGIMFGEKLLCVYCLVTHLANLAFVALSEKAAAPSPVPVPRRGMAIAAAVFGVVSGALGLAEYQTRGRAKAALADSLSKAGNTLNPPGGTGPTGPTGLLAPTGTAAATGGTGAQPAVPQNQPKGFTGRYRLGPENAPIRVVMFTDYGCPDCRTLESQMRTSMAKYPNISLSIKHFPFCTACNDTPNLPNLHPNSCWAARAAEAAGVIGGNEGFWKMHHWLFDQKGSFTDQTFPPALQQMGFEPARFLALMQSQQTLDLVKADIVEARRYGLMRTPMVFINAVEIKNWNVVPDALPKALATMAESNPGPGSPESDRPPNAGDKAVADWREAIAMGWASRKQPWTAVAETAPVRIMLFGDFLEAGTAQADRAIREAVAGRSDIRYEFRYFPFDQACNSYVPRTGFPNACRAAAAAEAAGQIGGADAYWRMHIWLMENQAQVQQAGDAAIRAAAATLGLDAATLLAAMDTPDVQTVVSGDANLASRIGMTEIPRVFVNFKPVTRWNLANEFILERVIEEAARPAATTGK